MPRPIEYRTPFEYPVYIFSHTVAELIGWNPQRVRRLWHKHGIAHSVGGRIATTPDELRNLWPEQWDAVLAMLSEKLVEYPSKTVKKKTTK